MYNQNAIKFSAHCINLHRAVRTLQADGFQSADLDEAAKNLIKIARKISNVDADILSCNANAFSLGICKTDQMEIGLDINIGFSLLITAETDADRLDAKKLMSSILTTVAHESNNYWRCISARDGAISFSQLSSVICSDALRFGGKVYSDGPEANSLLDKIYDQLDQNVLNSHAENIFDYIISTNTHLPIITLAVFDLSSFSELTVRKMRSLCNHMKAGLNIIVVDQDSSVSNTLPFELQVSFRNGQFFFQSGNTAIPAIPTQHKTDIADLNALLQKKEISSRFEDIFDGEITPFTKLSTECIEIPLALLENGDVCYFRIGGKNSPHALISGQTGSGKSVTLHTIIDLITLYYRPDDVEIWAIDYKAVEFKCYVDNRTPHISVIGQDNSVDFSIGLMKLLVKEYNRRKKLFTDASVTNLEGYRKKFGDKSITRLLIVIDEFHNLIQAIQNYPSNEYKILFDNLLKEARSMGMSFVFCSQSVANGLTGMPESAKNQIGIRICMKQNNSYEITETLLIKSTNTDLIDTAKNFDKGFAYYNDGESGTSNIKKVKILFVSDEIRDQIIDCVNAKCNVKDWNKDEKIYKDSNRYTITEKPNHALNLLLENRKAVIADVEETNIYPAAPVSFDNEFTIELSRNSSNNVLISGNNDDMRESMVFYSVCSILSNPCNSVIVNVPDPDNPKSASLLKCLKLIGCERLTYRLGIKEVLDEIEKASVLQSDTQKSTFYIWSQLNKLRSAMAIEASRGTAQITPLQSSNNDILSALDDVINSVKSSKATTFEQPEGRNSSKVKTFDSVSEQLKLLFEYGPEQGIFNVVVYQTPKNFEKDKFLKITDFDYRLATQMSADDSYRMFGRENFVNCTNESTAVCYEGNKTPVPVRPYLMPDHEWINKMNKLLKGVTINNVRV